VSRRKSNGALARHHPIFAALQWRAFVSRRDRAEEPDACGNNARSFIALRREGLEVSAKLENAMNRAAAHAPFLAEAMTRRPDLVALLRTGAFDTAIAASLTDSTSDVRVRLRRQREALALCIAIGDLAGVIALEQVVALLSDFADRAMDVAIAEAVRLRMPDADPVGFVAIALGKHGSRELNYSSDIDPILLYDPDTMPHRDRDDVGEAAVRIARTIVDLLQTRDENGYVFRVDLRLRPASEATPLAIPVDAAISHYESSALGWERAAFIRARAAAGDKALGQRFLHAIQPFIWRRSLDFGAIEDLRAMSRRIRSHHSGGQAFGPGYDLKRGRGGIREVEFFVQIQQLVHGGRNPALRVPDTLGAIAALTHAGWIDTEAAATLSNAYRLFRTIEHRLQMVDDRQTHTLPTDQAALDNVARLHGLDSGDALLGVIEPYVGAVGALYDALDGDAETRVPVSGSSLVDALTIAGFSDAATAARRIGEWRSGKLRAVRSDVALQAMEAVLPDLIAAFGKAPDSGAALGAFDAMLAGLPSAVNLFRLLEAQPNLRRLLVEIVSHAPTLADALGRNPALLDRLLDASAFDCVGSVPDLAAEMRTSATDIETRLDRVRQIVSEHRFALGVQIVEGAADPGEVATGYARVAEAAVVTVADAVIDSFVAAHGRVPESELVVLALGRLGGGALTHASDLDLIYLFTGNFEAESDGLRPLGATHYYNRLGQRLSGGLSAPTSAGALYEIDTRLRPSGNDGPLVVSLDSFARYQREQAWTWEHMALTRARPIYGSKQARATLSAVITEVLQCPRDATALARDVVTMRADMATHKPPLGLLDVKLQPGGLVDLEFTIHFHQLAAGTGLSPSLPEAIDSLASAGLVEGGLRGAHDLLTRLIVTLRLVSPNMELPGLATRVIVARACGAADWDTLLAQIDDARQCVTRHWRSVLKAAGEEI
jgi:[glutamine synthetase] adenylyltransferase / [glutamine synthetase]-adenylyl-L-tyrosine phosphorylase